MLTVPFPQIPLVHLCDAKFSLELVKRMWSYPRISPST